MLSIYRVSNESDLCNCHYCLRIIYHKVVLRNTRGRRQNLCSPRYIYKIWQWSNWTDLFAQKLVLLMSWRVLDHVTARLSCCVSSSCRDLVFCACSKCTSGTLVRKDISRKEICAEFSGSLVEELVVWVEGVEGNSI